MKETYIFDTTGLYALDPLFTERKHLKNFERRTKEVLGNFIDAYLDDDREFKLVIPNPKRLKDDMPLPLAASYLLKKKKAEVITPKNFNLDDSQLQLLFEKYFMKYLDKAPSDVQKFAEFHLHPDIIKGHTNITDSKDALPGVPKAVLIAVAEGFRKIDQTPHKKYSHLVQAAFGICQRGATYAATAKEHNGIYMTHPIRFSSCGDWEKEEKEEEKEEEKAENLTYYLSTILIRLTPDNGFESPDELFACLDELRDESFKNNFLYSFKDVLKELKGDPEKRKEYEKTLVQKAWDATKKWNKNSISDDRDTTTLGSLISRLLEKAVIEMYPHYCHDGQIGNVGIAAEGPYKLKSTGLNAKPDTSDEITNCTRKHVPLITIEQGCSCCGIPPGHDCIRSKPKSSPDTEDLG